MSGRRDLTTSETTAADRPPRGVRLLQALGTEPDWSAMTADELVAFRERENRKRASRLARVVTGRPARGAATRWHELHLPGRDLPVRVHRPTRDQAADGSGFSLVLHVHGGGFVGTAAQSDWLNSHLAVNLPAVVVSVEHRLLDPETPLAAAVDDGWDALRHVVEHASSWGLDPARVAVVGESTGGLIAALAAIRARDAGLPLRAQVLVNACVDVATPYDHASMRTHAESPTLTTAQMQMLLRLALPPGSDARALSPLHADDVGRLAPALLVVPTIDPVADQARRYAERLVEAGTPAAVREVRGATHAFLSMPGLVPQATPARAAVLTFLAGHLRG